MSSGQLYTQSGGSEVEALQEAYRQIHSVDDSDQHLGDRGGAEGPAPPPSPPQQSLQPASTKDSGQTPLRLEEDFSLASQL